MGSVSRLSPKISWRLNTPRGRSAVSISASLASWGRSALTVKRPRFNASFLDQEG